MYQYYWYIFSTDLQYEWYVLTVLESIDEWVIRVDYTQQKSTQILTNSEILLL